MNVYLYIYIVFRFNEYGISVLLHLSLLLEFNLKCCMEELSTCMKLRGEHCKKIHIIILNLPKIQSEEKSAIKYNISTLFIKQIISNKGKYFPLPQMVSGLSVK